MTLLRSLSVSVSFSLAALTVSAGVRADSSNSAAAQMLFDEALSLMDKGRAPEACPKLEESQRLDPGPGTQYRLAQCYEQTKKLASAWSLYVEVAEAARRGGAAARAADAQKRADALAAKLPRIRVSLAAGANTSGLEVTRNGTAIGSALLGREVPVDGGTQTVRATAPNRLPFTTTVVAKEGAVVTVEIPVLVAEGGGSSSGSGMRTAGIVIGAVGIAGLGVGAIGAMQAKSKWDGALAECPSKSHKGCSQEGVRLGNDADLFANVANVGFIAGGVLSAVGLVLFVAAPSGKKSSEGGTGALKLRVDPAPDGGRVEVRGTF